MTRKIPILSITFAALLYIACSAKAPQIDSSIIAKPAPIPETIQDPDAGNPFIYVRDKRFYFKGNEYKFKGVNYYPSRNNWRRMWEAWNIIPIKKELGLLKDIGVNTVRIFLDYDLFERHREQGDSSIMLTHLDELLMAIDEYEMKALITPFVWGRGNLKTDKLHIRHLASRYKDDDRVFGWDISNELDHCWIDNPTQRASTMKWASGVYETLKETDKNHLITVGDYGWYLGDRNDPYGTGIDIDLSLMSLPPDKQDFVCFHWYSHYLALEVALEKLATITSKPIVIEEIGLPTGGLDDSGAPWYLSEEQVAGYLHGWMTAAEKYKAYLMPWCGFDYDPGNTHFSKSSHQLFFGLFATDYRLKANGAAFRDGSKAARKLKASALPMIRECRRRD